MKPAEMKRIVSDAISILETAANYSAYIGSEGARAQDLFSRMRRESEEVEREHRRFGRSFTRGQAAYHLSVVSAADLIAFQKVADALAKPTRPRRWLDAATTRRDVVTAYALAECIRDSLKAPKPLEPGAPAHQVERRARDEEYRRKLRTLRKAIVYHEARAIDYAEDVAK